MKKVNLLLPLAAFCIGMASAGCSAKPQSIPAAPSAESTGAEPAAEPTDAPEPHPSEEAPRYKPSEGLLTDCGEIEDLVPVAQQRLSEVKNNRYQIETYSDFTHEYAYFLQNGKRGVVDFTGTVWIQPEEEANWCSACYFVTERVEEGKPASPGYGKDFAVRSQSHGHCITLGYCYDLNSGKILFVGDGDELKNPEELVNAGIPSYGCLRVVRFTLDEENVYDSVVEYTDRVVVVDKNWKTVTQPDLEDGIYTQEGIIAAKKDGKWGYFREDGAQIIPYEYEDALSFHNGAAAVKKNGKWGYISESNRPLTGFVYEEARTASNGRAWVMENGEWSVVTLPF